MVLLAHGIAVVGRHLGGAFKLLGGRTAVAGGLTFLRLMVHWPDRNMPLTGMMQLWVVVDVQLILAWLGFVRLKGGSVDPALGYQRHIFTQ